MTVVQTTSPVDFQFSRGGGADIQGEVQVWPKKASYSSTDRPVHRIPFNNPLTAQEAQSVSLTPGQYICVFLGIARESLNGVYALRLALQGKDVFSKSGDVNETAKPNEFQNFRANIPLTVKA